jgi:hypothetical protein
MAKRDIQIADIQHHIGVCFIPCDTVLSLFTINPYAGRISA